MVENPVLCDALLEEALRFNVGLLDQCRDLGLDGVRFIEDWGQQHGLIMGERLWARYLKPRLRQMYAAAKQAGLVVLIHSCGDIRALFPHLIEIAVDVVNPIQPEVMDIAAIKREYGHDLVLYGGVGAQSLLVHGTPDLVKSETRRIREMMRRGGGYIFGNAGAFATDTPVENVMALLEVAREH
jgi:uroporphyrinogen decarboxylase